MLTDRLKVSSHEKIIFWIIQAVGGYDGPFFKSPIRSFHSSHNKVKYMVFGRWRLIISDNNKFFAIEKDCIEIDDKELSLDAGFHCLLRTLRGKP